MPGAFSDQRLVGRSDERSGAVVALKALRRAKSRFAGIDDLLRQRLVWAMALDTLAAVTASVDRTVLVTAEPSAVERLQHAGLAVEVLADPNGTDGTDGTDRTDRTDRTDSPLNSAFTAGIQALASGGCTLVACVMADLPALTPAALVAIMEQARVQEQPVLVSDAGGIGTTMIAGRPGRLQPGFGGPSTDRHRRNGLVDADLDDDVLGGARLDVDDQAALIRARGLGLGPRTARLLRDSTILDTVETAAAAR